MINLINFSSILKKLRLDKNFTQKQISEYLGIHSNSYQAIEYGKTKPALDTVIKLANYFDVSTDYLLGRTDNPNSHKL